MIAIQSTREPRFAQMERTLRSCNAFFTSRIVTAIEEATNAHCPDCDCDHCHGLMLLLLDAKGMHDREAQKPGGIREHLHEMFG